MDEDNTNPQTQDGEEQLEQSSSDEQLNEVVEESAQTDESQETEEEQPELSPRQQKRVEQVEEQAKEYKLNKILDRIQNTKQTPSQRENPLDYREAIDAPDEVYNTLDKDRSQYGDQRYNEGLEVAKAIEFRTNIRLDLPIVKEKLDKLDPQDAATLDREYLQFVGFNPKNGTVQHADVGYADFIEARIEQAERLARSMTQQTHKNIAKQAAQVGVRPDGSTRSGVKVQNPGDISSMSDDDFEKNRASIYKSMGLPFKQ